MPSGQLLMSLVAVEWSGDGLSFLHEAGRDRHLEDRSIRWYRSAVDWWLGVLLGVPPIVLVLVTVFASRHGDLAEIIWSLGSLLLVAGVYFGLIFPMTYGIGTDELTVRFGCCRRRIRLADILEVRPTRNPLSSPAMSLDRLHIQFGSGLFRAIMISPLRREQFLLDLAKSAGLHRDGNRLVRQEPPCNTT